MRASRILLSLFLITTCFGQLGNVNLKPLPGMQFVNRTHRLGRGLVAYWPLNERSGVTAFDLSGNGNTMDFVNSPVWSPGKFGSSILFDDLSEQYLTVNTPVVVNYPFTLVIWFNSDLDDNQCLIGLADGTGVGEEWRLYAAGGVGGDPVVFRSRNGANNKDAATTTGYTLNKWHCVFAVGVSATERYVWIDNGSMGSNTTNSTPSGLTNTSLGIQVRSSVINPFSGKISDAMIYNRALSASERAELYKERDSWMFQRGDIELMAKSVAAPPPAGGQLIMIQMSMIPLFLIFTLVCFIRGKEIGK